ncbi:MAG: protein kinase [Chloroflexota bacterium]
MIAHETEELSGQQIGNYEIVSLVADHKVSELFLARDIKLNDLFIWKCCALLRMRMQTWPPFPAAYGGCFQLKQENIAVVTDIDMTEDGRPYAVIDYFPGITLQQHLDDLRRDDQALTPIEALELGRELGQGLSAAHAVDLIHHDLRPKNIMLREDGVPVWVDFGVPVVAASPQSVLAKSEDDMLDYASPEELEGKTLTRRSNIYSVGVILYELLAGHRPQMPTLPFDIFPQANMPKEEPLEDARPGLAGETYRLVRNCLWRQEWSRFETADEMLTAIETAIFAEQELPKAAAWTPGRSRSFFFLIPIAVLALAALAFLFVRGIRGNGGDGPEPTVAVVATTGSDGTVIAGIPAATEDIEEVTPSPTATIELPTESPPEISIDVLLPASSSEFGPQDTINFAWYWPTIPEVGRGFTVFLIDGVEEFALGSLTEPTSGSTYRLSVPVAELPSDSQELTWQVRLEDLNSGEIFVSSDAVPRRLLPPEPSVTPTITETPSPTPTATPTATSTTVCIVSPPPGWSVYVVQQGDALAGLALDANVPIATVMRVNCLESDLLSVGHRLWLPGVPSTATPQPSAPQPPATSTPGSSNGDGGNNPPPATAVPTEAPTDIPAPTDVPPAPSATPPPP